MFFLVSYSLLFFRLRHSFHVQGGVYEWVFILINQKIKLVECLIYVSFNVRSIQHLLKFACLYKAWKWIRENYKQAMLFFRKTKQKGQFFLSHRNELKSWLLIHSFGHFSINDKDCSRISGNLAVSGYTFPTTRSVREGPIGCRSQILLVLHITNHLTRGTEWPEGRRYSSSLGRISGLTNFWPMKRLFYYC